MVVTMVIYTEAWDIAFKTSKPSWKIWKYKTNRLHILKKTNLKPERNVHNAAKSHYTQKIYRRSMSSKLKILLLKNNFVFIEGSHLPHRQISLWEGWTFYYKVQYFWLLSKLYFCFISLKKILRWVKYRKRMISAFHVSLIVIILISERELSWLIIF